MIEVQAPAFAKRANVFLAGGISGADNWQPRALEMLEDTNDIVFNPRRTETFLPSMEEEQIKWEFDALRKSDAIIFWFPAETLCPITLYELGVWANMTVIPNGHTKPIYVGTDPAYLRRSDVIIQMRLAQPELFIHDNLEDVVEDYVSHQSLRFLK